MKTKKYHVIDIIPKSNWNITERGRLICLYNKTMNGSSYALTNQSEHLQIIFEYVEHKNIGKIS